MARAKVENAVVETAVVETAVVENGSVETAAVETAAVETTGSKPTRTTFSAAFTILSVEEDNITPVLTLSFPAKGDTPVEAGASLIKEKIFDSRSLTDEQKKQITLINALGNFQVKVSPTMSIFVGVKVEGTAQDSKHYAILDTAPKWITRPSTITATKKSIAELF